MRKRTYEISGLAVMLGLFFISCASEPREVVLASTTSTEDSGLFEYLLPAFREAHPGFRVRVIAVGSGEALRLAARGDADAVLTHSPWAEDEFMSAGHGDSRRRVMYNDFVIVGPDEDPADVCGFLSAPQSLACIAGRGLLFVARGDDSGTHARERQLWAAAGLEPWLERLDLRVERLYFEPDGTFPNHEADPLKLENLRDVLIAIDGGIYLAGGGSHNAVRLGAITPDS